MATSTVLNFQLVPETSTSHGCRGPKAASRSMPPSGGTNVVPECFSSLRHSTH
jgi:hypothetical protein